ncbi:MAG: YciK family oxidoreductase [Pseudomonadales bacterium]|jgi:NAD(P)-dependent dehydrogenase (short-subunit alcohol dehydrogenase family)|nr:YciK family oxidoreductase [Pseudomonadales bacterium]MDP6472050.1 YciK family oxidoreductase [Pseudomonadales bacterium]MDP6826677.1 YciK family oxidoreductase [Pseudomonadales bacterium]MDP6969962.1 YciK family oxidoreductase [Pseudomonadales bacterium]|tara:strand:+ start:670 stop:1482 length:813 start_codon:yes stop_codon:yes gene_type:complete
MPPNPDRVHYPELEEARVGWRWQPPADCLDGRTIVVTGAGAGIGLTAAKTFAAHGANVVLLGRTRAKLEAAFDWISANTGTSPVIVPCDLEALSDDSTQALHDAILDAYGLLHGVLHNASALGPRAAIAHYPRDQWRSLMAVNVEAPFVLTKALLPLMERSGSASILMTSSSVGRQGRAYWGAYAVSKFALEGLTQVLSDETEHAGIVRVNSVNPGGTRTAMRASAYPAEDPSSVPPGEAHMDLYLYLMSDASRGVTGKQFDCRSWTSPD